MKQQSTISGRKGAGSITVACTLSVVVLGALLNAATPSAQAPSAAKGKVETYHYFVFSNAVEGREDEYNQWYDNQHAPDVVAVPGFVTAQRYIASDAQLRDSKLPAKYLVIYKVVTDHLAAVQAEVSRRRQTGMTVMSPAFAGGLGAGGYYKVISPLIEHQGSRGPATEGHAHTYYQFVFSNSAPGRESEYDTWYDKHVRDVVSVPGFVEGQRLSLTDNRPPSPGQTRYRHLAMFKIVSDNLRRVFDDFRAHAPQMSVSPALAESAGYTYKTWGRLIWGDQVRAERAKKKE